jgi:hypothetical protein
MKGEVDKRNPFSNNRLGARSGITNETEQRQHMHAQVLLACMCCWRIFGNDPKYQNGVRPSRHAE